MKSRRNSVWRVCELNPLSFSGVASAPVKRDMAVQIFGSCQRLQHVMCMGEFFIYYVSSSETA